MDPVRIGVEIARAKQSGVIEGQTEEHSQTQSLDDASGVFDGTWEDWNDYDDWSWHV